MRLKIVLADEWTVMAPLDARGRCPMQEELDSLALSDDIAHAQILARLERVAQRGPDHDLRHSRHVCSGVYELKTQRGWRLFYFFDRNRVVVCAELCRKPKPRELHATLRRARALHTDYFRALARNTLTMETDP